MLGTSAIVKGVNVAKKHQKQDQKKMKVAFWIRKCQLN
jgi:ribosomal protein L24